VPSKTPSPFFVVDVVPSFNLLLFLKSKKNVRIENLMINVKEEKTDLNIHCLVRAVKRPIPKYFMRR
jgi:hypothetical protein